MLLLSFGSRILKLTGFLLKPSQAECGQSLLCFPESSVKCSSLWSLPGPHVRLAYWLCPVTTCKSFLSALWSSQWELPQGGWVDMWVSHAKFLGGCQWANWGNMQVRSPQWFTSGSPNAVCDTDTRICIYFKLWLLWSQLAAHDPGLWRGQEIHGPIWQHPSARKAGCPLLMLSHSPAEAIMGQEGLPWEGAVPPSWEGGVGKVNLFFLFSPMCQISDILSQWCVGSSPPGFLYLHKGLLICGWLLNQC